MSPDSATTLSPLSFIVRIRQNQSPAPDRPFAFASTTPLAQRRTSTLSSWATMSSTRRLHLLSSWTDQMENTLLRWPRWMTSEKGRRCVTRSKGRGVMSLLIHSKNSRARFDPEKSPRGQTHFGVRPTRNPGQTDPESESDWPGIRVRKTFWTQIPVIFTPDSRSV